MKKIIFLNFILGLLCVSLAYADVNVQGTYYTVLQNGSVADKYDIVFIGDGFRDTEQNLFNQKVEDAVNGMRNRSPYKENMCGFNIWRVNVISQESGCDHPLQNSYKNTELNCTYGNNALGNPERLITTSTPWLCYEAAAYAPGAEAVFVLVNDQQWGGGSGNIVTACIGPGFETIVTHELGHFVGRLADEYDYGYPGCYSGGEPSAVNITIQTDPNLIKWKDLILPGTPIPTTVDDPPGVVGLWGGAYYHTCGVYRPQFTCHMRTTASEFCKVCSRHLSKVLGGGCTICDKFPGICAKLYMKVAVICPIRWPFPGCGKCPVCLSCPFKFENIKSEVILEGLNSRKYILEVINENGKVVATGESFKDNSIKLSFEQNSSMNYYLQLMPAQKGMQAEMLNMNVNIKQNGRQLQFY